MNRLLNLQKNLNNNGRKLVVHVVSLSVEASIGEGPQTAGEGCKGEWEIKGPELC